MRQSRIKQKGKNVALLTWIQSFFIVSSRHVAFSFDPLITLPPTVIVKYDSPMNSQASSCVMVKFTKSAIVQLVQLVNFCTVRIKFFLISDLGAIWQKETWATEEKVTFELKLKSSTVNKAYNVWKKWGSFSTLKPIESKIRFFKTSFVQ